MFSHLLSALAIILALAVYRLRKIGQRPKDYPPGPPTLPFIGNLHQIPKKDPHHQYKKWAEEYGDIYSLVLGTQVMIVLSSDKAIKDLLDKRSNIYSSRTESYLGFEIGSESSRVLLMQYGEQWRMIRRIMHSILHINASKGYVPYQDLENKQMLNDLLDKPSMFVEHIRRFTSSLTMQMVYGTRCVDAADDRLTRFYHGFERWAQIVGSVSAILLDVYPILRQLPNCMVPALGSAREVGRVNSTLYKEFWSGAKKRVMDGTSKPCFSVGIVESQLSLGFAESIAYHLAGSIFEAGSDTTAATLVGFIQAMVLYPDAQRLIQTELDRVCGTHRLPTIDDWDTMPHVRAAVKESLRWMPTAVMGVPHAVTQEDEYRGYRIPKGAGVMWNVWAIHQDEKRFARPRVFDPTRYLGDGQTSAEAAMNPDPTKRDQFVFGAGRRVCQGMHIADRSMFLAISRLLWAFDVGKALDAEGREITPDQDDLTEGFLVQPTRFPARFTPRSEKHARLVRDEWAAAQGFLDGERQWKTVPKGMAFKSHVSEDLLDRVRSEEPDSKDHL